MWLSLIRIPSARLRRWFCPPPMTTAYFSRLSESGRGLASIDDPGVQAIDRIDVATRLGGNSAEALDEVQGRSAPPLSIDATLACDGGEPVAGGDSRSVFSDGLDLQGSDQVVGTPLRPPRCPPRPLVRGRSFPPYPTDRCL